MNNEVQLQNIQVEGLQNMQMTTEASAFMGIFGVLIALSAFIMMLGYFVTWIIALVQVIRRTDLKESRILWILLLFVVGPLGVLLYAFIENRKTFGYWTLACYIGLPVVIAIGFFVSSMLA